jgi:hypothetical protein
MAACPGARQPSAGKGPSHEQLRHRGRRRAPGRAGRRARQGGDPAPGRSTSSGSGRAAVARYRAGHGAAVVRGHPATRRPGLGRGGPGLPGLGIRLPGAGGDRTPPPGCCPTASPTRRSRWWPGCCWPPASAWAELGRLGRGLLAAASVGGLFLLLAPHGMGVAMASWPRPWAWRSAGCRGDGGGGGRLPARRPGGAGRHAGTWPVAHGAAAVRPLAGRCAAGRPGRRRGRRLVPGLLARRQVGRVSPYRR